jgi:hypothetical protein
VRLKINQHFEGIFRLHFQGQRTCHVRNQSESRWKAEQSACIGLQGVVISQKTELCENLTFYEDFSALRSIQMSSVAHKFVIYCFSCALPSKYKLMMYEVAYRRSSSAGIQGRVSKTAALDVIGFLCVSLGSSRVQLHESLGSRRA